MTTEVKIPAVGESITSGLLSTWHKKDGEQVKAGDILFTLETDKVSTEVVAERDGIIRVKVPEGAEVKIGEVVAEIGDGAGATPSPAASASPESAPAPVASAAVTPAPIAVEAAPVVPREETVAPSTAATSAPVSDTAAQLVTAFRTFASAPVPAEPVAAQSVVEGRTTRKRLSPLRRKIAAQLVMAQQTAAILTTFNECDMTAIMELRNRVQPDFQKQHGVKLGFMSFFIKATVKALQDLPAINGRMDGDDFIQNHYFDIGVAVGTERGLIVPVIRDADQKSFAQIENDLIAYAQRAREGKIGVEDLQGGVFTISNGGVYGSLLSTPILNPPQSGILGMHKIQERPVALNGQVVIRPMMYLALSYDHRVVDGKEAVTFLIKVKEAIEDPVRLLIGV